MKIHIQKTLFALGVIASLVAVSPDLRGESPKPGHPQTDQVTIAISNDQRWREDLKTKFSFKNDGSRYTWTYTKQDASDGNDFLEFQNSRSLNEISGGLKELTSRPWGEFIKHNQLPTSTEEQIPFDKISILKLRVLDIQTINLYHQTSFRGVQRLVDLSPEIIAKGSLKTEDIQFSNQEWNPAFFTHIDPGNSLSMDLGNIDSVLKVQIKNKKNVFLMELYHPVNDFQIDYFFEKLTGQQDYWKSYRNKFQQGNQYDFDLFEGAVIAALRDVYQIPVDLTLYVKDYTFRNMGIESRNVYSWGIIHDRELLRGSLVPIIFDGYRTVHHPTKGNGVDESQYPPLSNFALKLYLKYPGLREALSISLSSQISRRPEISKKILKLKNPQDFWADGGIYNSFVEDFLKPDSNDLIRLSELLEKLGFSQERINDFVAESLLGYWNKQQSRL